MYVIRPRRDTTNHRTIAHETLGLPPELWPVGWKLWREDKFDGSTGTVFNRWMWLLRKDYLDNTTPAGVETISALPGGGMRLTTYRAPDPLGGPNIALKTWLMSGWVGYLDEFGRKADAFAQRYNPPFVMTLQCRFSEITHDRRHATFAMQEKRKRSQLPWAAGKPDQDSVSRIEIDGDEFYTAWVWMSQPMHFWVEDSEAFEGNIFQSVMNSVALYPSRLYDKWYDLMIFVDSDSRPGGQKIVVSGVNKTLHMKRPSQIDPVRADYIEDSWDVPYIFNIVLNYTGAVDPVTAPMYYDVRNFRVWIPPDDPRLDEPFTSNVPGWTGDPLPTWPI